MLDTVYDNMILVDERDELLSEHSKAVLRDRYLLGGETYQEMFARVSKAYGDDEAHAQRMYDYISKLWFMPSTPILSNGGTERGLPISCFLNETDDSLGGIMSLWNENIHLASKGGGIGSYWGNIRSIGETLKAGGKTSGIIPFIHVQDSLTLAISQGSLRRGSTAVYLPVHHPEIEEFIDLRKPTGGDLNRRSLNIHHGIIVNDSFMNAMLEDKPFDLVSPKTGEVLQTVMAREIWIKILTQRVETGEPYIIFEDALNKYLPQIYKELGLKVKMSNLCSEITLATGADHLGEHRTAVCCLGSLNLELYEEYKSDPKIVEDCVRFLDNVLQAFIENAPEGFERAKYSASRERSIGLGVMGFHSLLQSKGLQFESVGAKLLNKSIFSWLRHSADKASKLLADEKGACPDALDAGFSERCTHKLSIAPTASISIIASGASPGCDPMPANAFVHKGLTGSFSVKNRHLAKVLTKYGRDDEDTWRSIIVREGSAQHLDFLSDEEKGVFRTSFEIDQAWIVEHASDRVPYVCQAQSTNLFLPPDVTKRYLHRLHVLAWKKGLKTLYYCRSKSLGRADKVSAGALDETKDYGKVASSKEINYDECLSCQ